MTLPVSGGVPEQGLTDAATWMANVLCGVGKAGQAPESGEYEAALEALKAALERPRPALPVDELRRFAEGDTRPVAETYMTAGAALPPQTGNPPGIPDVQALSCIAQTGNPPPDLAPIVRDLMSALWTQTRLICTEEDHPRSMRCQSCASRESINRAEAALRGVSSLRAPQSGPLLPDTFVERAIRTALAQPEYKLEGDTVVGLSGAEAAFIRQKYAERNRGSGAETPPQPDVRLNACQRCGFAPCECDS